MKYGETLQQRSIPGWGAYNLDYNEIKRLIKERTCRRNDPQAPSATISVPGQSLTPKSSVALETELFTELQGQHARIDLFVKSKLGELTRRLKHLDKQVLQLARQHKVIVQTHITVKRLEKYSKVEGDVLKVGEELQSLDRFVSVQRLGFRKLLKKYQKWTGSSSLGEKLRSEVLGQERSFTNCDLTPLLTDYADVLTRVRAPFEAGVTWRECEPPKERRPSRIDEDQLNQSLEENAIISRDFQPRIPKNAAAELHHVFEDGSDVDVDTALSTLPLGDKGGRATYWIHNDNLFQMHVFLLQFMRLRQSEDYITSHQSSRRPSRRSSTHGFSSDTAFLVQDEIETILCDDLRYLAQRQNISLAANSKEWPDNGWDPTAANIRYLSTGEAIVTICANTSNTATPALASTSTRTKVKRRRLRQLFSSQDDSSPTCSNPDESQIQPVPNSEQRDDFERVRQWLQIHQNVQPLVHLTFRKTRFIGLSNNLEKGIWASLDKDVSMKKTSLDDLSISKDHGNSGNSEETARFPHAILDVRWEGRLGEDLIKALDKSHLTERVRGFTLESHAVATLYQSLGMPAPFWLPTLEKDIRKLPPKAPLSRKHSSMQTTPESVSTRPTSTSDSVANGYTNSDFSTAACPESPATMTSVPVPTQLEAPPLKAFRKKRRSQSRKTSHPKEGQINDISRVSNGRYWNEFDDDAECANEPYTILINLNESMPFPGMDTVSHMTQAVKAWFNPSVPGHADLERQALLPDHDCFSPSSSCSSLSALSPHHNTDRYATFPSSSRPRSHSHTMSAVRDRNVRLKRYCAAAFMVFAVLLLATCVVAFI